MYQTHFGVMGDPFANTPDTDRFFHGAKRGAVLDALQYAIERGDGIIKVVGEVGTGKTMLCRMLADTLPKNIDIVYLANPSLSPDTILHAIAAELNLPNVTAHTSKLEVLQELQAHLLHRHANNHHVVLLVEEAQCMPMATLEEIRLLSNLETHRHKLLQIVLFGQPELDETLALRSLRQLRERISNSFYLEPFDSADVGEYLNFKLHAAGDNVPNLFDSRTTRAVHRYSNGLVRRVNFLADKTLLAAFSENSLIVQPRHVRIAAKDCEFHRRRFPLRPDAWYGAGATAALALAAWVLTSFGLPTTEYSKPAKIGNASDSTVAVQKLASASNGSAESDENVVAIPPTALASNTDVKKKSDNVFADALEIASLEMARTNPIPLPRSADNDPRAVTLTHPLTSERISATEQWTKGIEPRTYTVQIMTTFIERTGELQGLERLVDSNENSPWMNDLYLHQGAMEHSPVLVVSYGGFDSVNAARTAAAQLPPSLTRYQPLVRTVRSLRTEIGIE